MEVGHSPLKKKLFWQKMYCLNPFMSILGIFPYLEPYKNKTAEVI